MHGLVGILGPQYTIKWTGCIPLLEVTQDTATSYVVVFTFFCQHPCHEVSGEVIVARLIANDYSFLKVPGLELVDHVSDVVSKIIECERFFEDVSVVGASCQRTHRC